MRRKQEERRAQRVERLFLVRYQCPSIGEMDWEISPIRNLSGTGLRFLAESDYPIGVILDLRLQVPTVEQPLVVPPTIIWKRRLSPSAWWDYGASFGRLPVSKRKAIVGAIQVFLPGQDVFPKRTTTRT